MRKNPPIPLEKTDPFFGFRYGYEMFPPFKLDTEYPLCYVRFGKFAMVNHWV